MPTLIHLIYCSASRPGMGLPQLPELLNSSRRKNARLGVTGLLLYAEGSFFQVLEGPAEVVDALYARIVSDPRHEQVTRIIREPIARRAFSDWSMGYVALTAGELAALADTGVPAAGESLFSNLQAGRARKLLAAFMHGRWRSRLSDSSAGKSVWDPMPVSGTAPFPKYSFAFQPIVDARTGTCFAYEALLRGTGGEPPNAVLCDVPPEALARFDVQSRVAAIEQAARLGLSCRLSLNFIPSTLTTLPDAIEQVLAAARGFGIAPERLIMELLEREVLQGNRGLTTALNAQRASGLVWAIDDFGAGYSGLNLLADFQPDFVKLDRHLVRGIPGQGPRQAIVRGIQRTCLDLGVEIVAEGVETEAEFSWLHREGITLFQGYLFARPGFEALPQAGSLPAAMPASEPPTTRSGKSARNGRLTGAI